jgi:hypothetical protein
MRAVLTAIFSVCFGGAMGKRQMRGDFEGEEPSSALVAAAPRLAKSAASLNLSGMGAEERLRPDMRVLKRDLKVLADVALSPTPPQSALSRPLGVPLLRLSALRAEYAGRCGVAAGGACTAFC